MTECKRAHEPEKYAVSEDAAFWLLGGWFCEAYKTYPCRFVLPGAAGDFFLV